MLTVLYPAKNLFNHVLRFGKVNFVFSRTQILSYVLWLVIELILCLTDHVSMLIYGRYK